MKCSTLKSTLTAVICLSVLSLAALPEMKITTKDNANPDGSGGGGGWGGWGGVGGWGGIGGGTYSYFNVTGFQINDQSDSRNNITRNANADSIKVRGNSTAAAAKKPYKVKFGEKVSLFGKEPAKSWILLANFYDATFSLNEMAFALGQRLGLEFTPTSQLVDLSINGTYKGIYQLTEKIQSNKGRVDLREKHRGWLVEFDYHSPASDERSSYFTTSKYDLTTFIKFPELDDTIPNRPASYLDYVKTDLNNLVNKMAENGFPNNGYRDLIDLDSYAKYVLIQLFLDNSDFNSKFQNGALPGSNYAYRIDSSSCSKIKAGPLWDFDLAIVTKTSHPRHDYNGYREPITPTQAFYKRLWEDPVFKAKYKRIWVENKSHFQALSGFIDSIKTAAEGSVNNNTWNSGTLNAQTFNTEIQNLKGWLNNRINWVDQQIGSNLNGVDGQLGIDGSKDIPESLPSTCQSQGTTPIIISQPKTNNNSNKSKIEVYNLQGKLVYSGYSENTKILQIPVLTKGIYIIKTVHGTQRMVVK
ncbi:MAG: CotH kinase family protein [Fibromonadaceae bacterium]|jgi:hypothetical protein|nr:CotH kinase family protein [Fibromonadaceae bacterium]